jgi:hypothetical protein
MTRTQVQLSITKAPTHYRDLNPGPLVSYSGPQTTRPAGHQTPFTAFFNVFYDIHTTKAEIILLFESRTSSTSLKPILFAHITTIIAQDTKFMLTTAISFLFYVIRFTIRPSHWECE